MECKYCGSEILDTYTICPICGKSLIEKQVLTAINSNLDSTEENKQNITKKELNRSKKMMAKCIETGFETEIDEDAEGFYCEEHDEYHFIDNDAFIKYPINQAKSIEKSITNVTVEKENCEQALYLILKNDEREFIRIPKKGGTIGRAGNYGAELFNKYNMRTVSREHIQISFRGGEKSGDWVISHLSKTNDTEVNGEKICHGSFIILKNGSEITLAKRISFKVEIK